MELGGCGLLWKHGSVAVTAGRYLAVSWKMCNFAAEITTFDMIREVLEQVISEDLADLWSVLSPDEKRLVMENFTLHHFKKNQIIYAEGEQPEMLWCLIKGKVKKWKEGIGGRSQILRLIRPVQYFGYRAYFAGEPYVRAGGMAAPGGREGGRAKKRAWPNKAPGG